MRRVCVIDEGSSKIRNLITQSAITKLLAAHQQEFAGLVDLSLSELEITNHVVPIVVDSKETYWTALKVIVSNVGLDPYG